MKTPWTQHKFKEKDSGENTVWCEYLAQLRKLLSLISLTQNSALSDLWGRV